MMKRYVFLGDKLDSIKKRIVRSDNLQFKRLIDLSNDYMSFYLPETHPAKSTTFMGLACLNLSLLFLLTNENKYLDEAKRWMLCVCNYEKWGNAHLVNVDLSASWIMFGLSLAYNWLGDYLTISEKEIISKKLHLQAKIMYEYRLETFGKGWSTNYYQNHNWINMNGLACAAYVLQNDYNDDSKKWLAACEDNFEQVFKLLPEDGSNYEGTVYWRYGVLWLFTYAHLQKIEKNINIFKQSKFLKNTFFYRLYQSAPDYEQTMNFGDTHDHRSSHCLAVYYKVASEYKNGYAQYLGNMVFNNFYYHEAVGSKVKPGILPEIGLEIIFFDPLIEEKPFDELPLTNYFKDLGLVSLRSSHEKDAVVFSFKSGYPGGKKQWNNLWSLYNINKIDAFSLSHQHPDNNAFILNAFGSYLASDDGYNRNLKTVEHNSITINQKGLLVENVNDPYTKSAFKTLEECPNYDIINKFKGTTKQLLLTDTISVFECENHLTYAYDLEIKKAKRTFISIKNQQFIIVDELASKQSHLYNYNFHTETKATKTCDNLYKYKNNLAQLDFLLISNQDLNVNEFNTHVKAVMTTQEPENYCQTNRNTLQISNLDAAKEMLFISFLNPKKIEDKRITLIKKITHKDYIGFSFDDYIFIYKTASKVINYNNVEINKKYVLLKKVAQKLVILN